MRIRTIKPEFHQNEGLAQFPREDRLLAAALLNWADDEGYFRTHPALIAGALFPFDADSRAFVTRGLAHLVEAGFLKLFEGGIGHITKFGEHQVINKPQKSRLCGKATTPIADSRSTPVVLPEDSRSPTGALREDSHTEGKGREVEGKGMEAEGNGGGRESKTPPAAEDVAGQFAAFVNDARAEVGRTPETPISDLSMRLAPVLLELNGDVERLKLGYLEYLHNETKYWAKQKPPHPLRGFLKQALDYVPRRAQAPPPALACVVCGLAEGYMLEAQGRPVCGAHAEQWLQWPKGEDWDAAATAFIASRQSEGAAA